MLNNIKYYIVYQITNKLNNYIYIGAHITNNINDSYMGSGSNIKKAIKEFGKENFIKETLFIFNNEEDMLNKELEIVNRDFISRNDTYNIVIGGVGFNTVDCVVVKDKTGNIFMTHITDPKYLSGELVSSNKGLITAKDINNKIYYITKEDPRWISGELVGSNTGKRKVIDKNGNIIKVDKNDIRILNGELTLYTTKRKHVKLYNVNSHNSGKIFITNKEIGKQKYVSEEELDMYLLNNWDTSQRYKNKKSES